MGTAVVIDMGEQAPRVNHYLEAEQWKARLNKEDVAYYHGRELRQKATARKIEEFNTRGSYRPETSSRPATGLSSVCFDAPRISRQSVLPRLDQSTCSLRV